MHSLWYIMYLSLGLLDPFDGSSIKLCLKGPLWMSLNSRLRKCVCGGGGRGYALHKITTFKLVLTNNLLPVCAT